MNLKLKLNCPYFSYFPISTNFNLNWCIYIWAKQLMVVLLLQKNKETISWEMSKRIYSIYRYLCIKVLFLIAFTLFVRFGIFRIHWYEYLVNLFLLSFVISSFHSNLLFKGFLYWQTHTHTHTPTYTHMKNGLFYFA